MISESLHALQVDRIRWSIGFTVGKDGRKATPTLNMTASDVEVLSVRTKAARHGGTT
jgi:hypothetical protein